MCIKPACPRKRLPQSISAEVSVNHQLTCHDRNLRPTTTSSHKTSREMFLLCETGQHVASLACALLGAGIELTLSSDRSQIHNKCSWRIDSGAVWFWAKLTWFDPILPLRALFDSISNSVRFNSGWFCLLITKPILHGYERNSKRSNFLS